MVKYVKFAVEKGKAGQTLAGDPLRGDVTVDCIRYMCLYVFQHHHVTGKSMLTCRDEAKQPSARSLCLLEDLETPSSPLHLRSILVHNQNMHGAICINTDCILHTPCPSV